MSNSGSNPRFLDSLSDVSGIDIKAGNRFRWQWLTEKDYNGDFLSRWVKKIKVVGKVWCIMCNDEVSYGSRGKGALKKHAQCKKHKAKHEALKVSVL